MTDLEFDVMFEQSARNLEKLAKTDPLVNDDIRRREHNKKHYLYLIREENVEPYLCSCCGGIETARYVEATRQRMRSKQLCFTCNFWDERVEEHKKKPGIIINHCTYGDGGRKAPGTPFLGFGGRKFIIFKDGVIWETNNLWCGGDIPIRYQTDLQDNAQFIRSYKDILPILDKVQSIVNLENATASLILTNHAGKGKAGIVQAQRELIAQNLDQYF